MIRDMKTLESSIASCTKAMDEKFKGLDGKRHIVLCGGTGCLSNNSMEIKERFEKILKDEGLDDQVTVNIVGCFGFCSQGPFVKIYPEDTLYRLVKVEDVDEIVHTDIVNHTVVYRLLYVDTATGEKVTKQEDINFYKKQRRVALHSCGEINPEDMNEALGAGAFQGLKRALSMTPQEVIDEVLASGIRGRGGAGFPSGRKWQFARNVESDEKYVVCNGDEGDPGAFMDRSILEGNPLAVIEGMMIAGYAIGASNGTVSATPSSRRGKQVFWERRSSERISPSTVISVWVQVLSSAVRRQHFLTPSKESAACPVPVRRSRQ